MARFFTCMAFSGMVIAVALMQCTAAQTVHVVGDNLGWTVPQNGASAYRIGRLIRVFNFTKNKHDVLQVPKASFDECSDDNPIGTLITNGPANVTLNSAGQHYFICTIGQHCEGGQKLSIDVSGSPTAGSTPPSGSGPGPNGNPNSSSSAVFASLLLSILAIVMGLIF